MRPNLPALTGLRFIAAAHVVMGHIAIGLIPPNTWLHEIIGTGYIGVTLFFLLSGFILAYNYNEKGHLRGTKQDFMVSRFARLYPLYALALLIAAPSFVLNFMRNGLSTVEALQAAILTPLMLQAWHPHSAVALAWNMPGWSLSTEVFFYLIFPLVLPTLARLRSTTFAFTAVTLWLVALLPAVGQFNLLPTLDWQEFVIHFPVFRLAEFSLGILTGLAFQRGWKVDGRWSLPLLILVGITLLALHPTVPKALISNGLLAPVFALLMLALAHGRGWFAGLLQTPPAQLLGEISYGIYLLHIPLYSVFRLITERVAAGFSDTWGGFFVFSLLLLLTSYLAYKLVEVPSRRWIRGRFTPEMLPAR